MSDIVAVIGGGPAGLMAAETLAAEHIRVELFDGMGSLGRKLLLAGRGGLNLTHSEPWPRFITRYGAAVPYLNTALTEFDPARLCRWAESLGQEIFTGSSGRVFPRALKASPLLRAWLQRLYGAGVSTHLRHRWQGWNDTGELHFSTPAGAVHRRFDAVILALGGGSWPQLGADGKWTGGLAARGIPIAPLQPANCGFDVDWSSYFAAHYAGQPLKRVVASCQDLHGSLQHAQGECVVTATGIEGGVIYALSSCLRERCNATGQAQLILDLLPEHSASRIEQALARPRGSNSVAKHLQRHLHINGAKFGLLRERLSAAELREPERVGPLLKSFTLQLLRPRPLAEAISCAGGVRFAALDEHFMLRDLPGVFCAGEMLDWEAPTGGYLLTACLATGRSAALGASHWLRQRSAINCVRSDCNP